jgi:predicted TIM-barrel fold metal-dependent hydrolase
MMPTRAMRRRMAFFRRAPDGEVHYAAAMPRQESGLRERGTLGQSHVGVRDVWQGPIIDADVHAAVRSLDALAPYLDTQWLEFIRERRLGEPLGLPVIYPANLPTSARAEWRRDDGQPAASEVGLLREHVLDPFDVDFAILHCYYGIDSIRYPDFSFALARAVNDWLIAEWLEPEPRLRASLVVPPRHPGAVADEIERVGGHPGFVQVYMPVRSDRLYGNREWHRAYDAMTRHDLVMGLHWGGTQEGAPSPTGWPSWYIEEYAAEQQAYMAQLTSMIGEGVFQVFPSLRVAVGEIGFAWLPSLMWRLQKEWKGLRRDIPWVNRPPADLIRDHFRFTVAPLDVDIREELSLIVEWIGSEDFLMFATDYPHQHNDESTLLLEVVSQSMQGNVMAETARQLYGLPSAPPKGPRVAE